MALNPVLTVARAWLEADPDLEDRAELAPLLERAERGDAAALRELAERFAGPLEFGTAGLRGVVGAGESRLNTAVVLRATLGLVRHLLAVVPDAARRGLVVGGDARPRSGALKAAAAEVAAALGVKVWLFPREVPTPVVAFAVQALGAAGGVVVTASHNPPEYNGYKVFFANGAQIVPPHDAAIAAEIAAAPPAREIPRASTGIEDVSRLEERYLDAIDGLLRPALPAARAELGVAYTALHGVGERFVRRAFARAGFSRLASVAEQAAPDGRFPTVDFPNPEEPGALSRVLALAERERADLVLANDPDADRLAVAARDAGGELVVLSGNEIGVLLAHHVLTRDGAPDPRALVVTTMVSSRMLGRMAERLGVRYAETLTGFKWIANRGLAAEAGEGARFAFGYEEALGYTVGDVARDKDGVSAALVFAELAAVEKARGRTVLDRLRDLRRDLGATVSGQRSLNLTGADGMARRRAAMERLRAARPSSLGGQAVTAVWDLEAQLRLRPDGSAVCEPALPKNDTVIFELEGGGRAAARPSGTEPKLKLYVEVVDAPSPDGVPGPAAHARAKATLDRLAELALGQA